MQTSVSKNFNPPAPRGTGHTGRVSTVCGQFISIHPPLAGRDVLPIYPNRQQTYFNPPAPRGTGLSGVYDNISTVRFQSTRPSRDGTSPNCVQGPRLQFQSTRPSRDGTKQCRLFQRREQISIHPPLAGRDRPASLLTAAYVHFNPPAPRGTGPVTCESEHGAVAISIHPRYFNPPAPRGTGRCVPAHFQL